MSYHLFLVDIRMPDDVKWVRLPQRFDWVIVRDYNEFVNTLNERGVPEFVAFDHDLADIHYAALQYGADYETYDKFDERTGYHCAEFLLKFCEERGEKLPNFVVHSMNPVGRQRINDLLRT